MNTRVQHALVLIDPSQDTHPSLERAKNMVAAASSPEQFKLSILISANPFHLKKQNQQTGFYCTDQWITETIRAPLDNIQAEYSLLFSWSEDFRQNILDIASEQDTSMTIVPFYGKVPSHILNHEKWKLLRNIDQPILLASLREPSVSGIILSALKTQDSSYEQRNQQITQVGQRLTQTFDLQHHVVNAYTDSSEYPDRARIASLANVSNDQIHVKIGPPEEVICEVVSEINPDLVLIASQRRKGLKATFVGNTVEKIIEQVGRDVLII